MYTYLVSFDTDRIHQCLTADAWASEVARPMFSVGGPWQSRDTVIAVFFILYMLVAYLIGAVYVGLFLLCK